MDVQSGESEEEEVMGQGIGEEWEIQKLVLEWGWRTDEGSWFQKQGEAKRKERSVTLMRMMLVDIQRYPTINPHGHLCLGVPLETSDNTCTWHRNGPIVTASQKAPNISQGSVATWSTQWSQNSYTNSGIRFQDN